MLIKNLHLSANEYLQKSTGFKEIINDVSVDRFQGLMNGPECSNCKSSAIHHSSTISCGKCNRVYHSSCLINDIDDAVSTAIKADPCLWWICIDCLSTNANNLVPTVESEIDVLIEKKLQTAIDGLKSDIISTIDNKLSRIPLSNSRNQSYGKRKAVDDSLAINSPKVPRILPYSSTKAVAAIETDGFPSLSTDTNSVGADVFINESLPQTSGGYASATKFNHALVNGSGIHSNQSRQNSVKPPKSNQPKFLLHFRPIISKRLILKTEEWYQLRRTISEKLTNIKVSFSNFNPKTGKVVIGFPNEKSKSTALTVLKDVTDLWCFENYIPEKMMPKLTIHNVPLDFDLPETTNSDIDNAYTQRDLVKDRIWQTIVDKNDGMKDLISKGGTLEIVYFKQRNFTATVAIKGSPEIRLHVIENCDSKLYLFSGRCKASDRCHYQQCYHCLKFGHIFRDCPCKAETPVCKFCTESHDSRTCDKKDFPNEHKCANCKSSKSPNISKAYNTHSAVSRDCPTAVNIVNRIQRNTQFAIPCDNSKNE